MLRGDEDITEGLLNAFHLEKGAEAFYLTASERVQDAGAVEMFKTLAAVENKHMHKIYELYHSFLGDRGPVPFPEFKAKISARFTESGKIIEAALSDVGGQFFMDVKQVLKAALREETAARDLYLNMAERAEDPGTAALYREFSADEEKHMAMIEKRMSRSGGS